MNNNSVLNSPWSHHVAVQNERRENKYDNTFALLSLLFVVNAKTKKQFVERGHLWLVRLRVSSGQERHSGRQHDAGVVGIRWKSWGIKVMVRVRLLVVVFGGLLLLVIAYRFCFFSL